MTCREMAVRLVRLLQQAHPETDFTAADTKTIEGAIRMVEIQERKRASSIAHTAAMAILEEDAIAGEMLPTQGPIAPPARSLSGLTPQDVIWARAGKRR